MTFFDMTNEFGKGKNDVSKYRPPTGTNLTPRLSRIIRFIEDMVSWSLLVLLFVTMWSQKTLDL